MTALCCQPCCRSVLHDFAGRCPAWAPAHLSQLPTHRPSLTLATYSSHVQIIDDDTWLVLEAADADDSDADSADSNAEGFYAHDYPGGELLWHERLVSGTSS